MAEFRNVTPGKQPPDPPETRQISDEDAHEHAGQRSHGRLANGGQVGKCSCDKGEPVPDTQGNASPVVGLRFPDSGRVRFFASTQHEIPAGTWVVAQTSSGQEAGRVVISPRQMLLSQLEGNLDPVERILTEYDVALIEKRRKDSSQVVRRGNELSRGKDMGTEVTGAEFSLDGSRLTVTCTSGDQDSASDLRDALEVEFDADIEIRSTVAREEGRLIGGLGKSGPTLSTTSSFPNDPHGSIGVATKQDHSTYVGEVAGLGDVSYENEQYKRAKQVLPMLGRKAMTPDGEGIVVALQVLKGLVTVRLDDSGSEVVYPASDLPEQGQRPRSTMSAPDASEEAQGNSTENRPRCRP